MARTWRLATLVAAAALGACGSVCGECRRNPSASPQADLPPGAACLGTAECAAGLECVGTSSDHPFGECYQGCTGGPGGCPAGTACDAASQRCAVSCGSDADCLHTRNGLRCFNSRCVIFGCEAPADCPAGTRCVEGQHVEGDIDLGLECKAGFCQVMP